jgi:hypothetical protein
MSVDQPRAGSNRKWPFVAALTFVVLIYVFFQYALKDDPSLLVQRVELCTMDYKHAPTARDTAEIDALTPPAKRYLRFRQTRTCGYFRKAGATK